ncbi:hypothetical protein SADUNF_Sadunf14G0138400 [Salix dunnii]|uniref:DUF4219 domain-containing protein n=1 Tax=Salix dunnii TaxID=1413687 RepID=A0A835JJF7_9ROSI|nr:hypothetical protein SADUNF_Sadunf14G0138400 [Salix dunnii]
MDGQQFSSGIKQLNHINYNTWSTCMMSYMQVKICGRSETLQSKVKDTNGTLRKWKIKVGKTLFALKTTIDGYMLKHIRDVKFLKKFGIYS